MFASPTPQSCLPPVHGADGKPALSSIAASSLRRFTAACLLGGMLCGFAARADTVADWRITPSPHPIRLQGFQEDEDLSGIARVGDFFVVVSDETKTIQTGRLDDNAAVIHFAEAVSLKQPLPESLSLNRKAMKDSAGEFDLEGICYAPEENAFYATGSHGMSKKKGEYDRQRFGVFRIPVCDKTNMIMQDQITESSLLPWLQNSADFKDYALAPLQQNGFNVEGLAWRGGRLFFGVRGPSVKGDSFIVEIAAIELFKDRGLGVTALTHRIPLGHERGIRELTSVEGGFLLICGNAAAPPSKMFPRSSARDPDAKFLLHFLEFAQDGTPGALHTLCRLENGGGLAEGLVVLSETEDEMDLLVVYDGLPQGNPTRHQVIKTAKPVTSSAPNK